MDAPARIRHAGQDTGVRWPALVASALACLILACGGSGGSPASVEPEPTAAAGGAQRDFLMGVSSLPAHTSEKGYRDAFEVAGHAGEVVLIQRTPPWSEFVPGGEISRQTEQVTVLEKELVREHDLRLFLAVDPTMPSDRSQIANLPEDLAGEGFANTDIRSAFISYAKYLALNYKPTYLALGVEVDMIFRGRGDGSFRNFISLYFEAYDEVKSVSPDTLVFPTFQYEDMLGLLDTGSSTLPSWTLVNRFEPKIDLLAVSSYPSLVFSRVSDVPLDYYGALEGRLDRPIAFASIGWNSTEAADGRVTEDSQPSYLYRAIAAAEDLDASMVVWYLGRDPESIPAGFEPLARMGLHNAAGQPKSVWRVWSAVLTRPLP